MPYYINVKWKGEGDERQLVYSLLSTQRGEYFESNSLIDRADRLNFAEALLRKYRVENPGRPDTEFAQRVNAILDDLESRAKGEKPVTWPNEALIEFK